MIDVLRENPILLLFVVASLGYFLGSIPIRGQSLGVSAVLFMGLLFGAIDPGFSIPDVILSLGLSIFVYSIGLSSGPAFFNSYEKNGLKDFLFIIAMMLFSGVIAILLWSLIGFSAASIVGVYSGSTTNTAAMASVIEMVKRTYEAGASVPVVEDIVVGYSFSYPMGVLGGMIAIVLMEKWLRIDYEAEKRDLRKDYPLHEGLGVVTIEIENPEVCNLQIRDLMKQHDWNVVFGRHFQRGYLRLASWDTRFEIGDQIRVTGSPKELEQVVSLFGKIAPVNKTDNSVTFDYRSIFVSNPLVAGRSIASLNIQQQYNAVITRIRRGDIDMLATNDMILELGDRVRFVARREDLDNLSTYFGDSYHQSSRINLFTFGLGIGLGLLLGTVEFSLGGQMQFRLGSCRWSPGYWLIARCFTPHWIH